MADDPKPHPVHRRRPRAGRLQSRIDAGRDRRPCFDRQRDDACVDLDARVRARTAGGRFRRAREGARLRRIRGPRARQPGRREDRRLPAVAVRAHGPGTRQQRGMDADGADDRDDREGRRGARYRGEGEETRTQVRRRHGDRHAHGAGAGVGEGQRRGVRRLRRRCAGAGLERLRRPGREGEDGGHPRQRPGLPCQRPEPVRRPPHDVLRALDVQVRRSCAQGRRGSADRARRCGRIVRLGRGAGFVVRCAVRSARERRPGAAPAGAGLDHGGAGRGAVRRRGTGFPCAARCREPSRVQADAAGGEGVGDAGKHDRREVVAERRRPRARHAAAGRSGGLPRALGPPGQAPRRGRRQHLQRRDRQRDGRSRRRRRSGRCCSSR